MLRNVFAIRPPSLEFPEKCDGWTDEWRHTAADVSIDRLTNPPTVAGAKRLLRAPCGERSVGEEKPLPIREANVGRVRRHSASVHAKRFNMAASYILPISLSVDNLGLLID
ncbi:hypothetical protein F2P81_004137 [Scophthalmus maximus]|uniref:Uncharacterized protein n=1 Tax=Scophthalmus maximus TaxID=52904 RepID=A0A6A4TGB0_SCOMX|nr:hypothetical protein F2P81_004137 [Scophthalmus maximus]